LFLSKLIKTENENFIYDTISDCVTKIPYDTEKFGFDSNEYQDFINENRLRDFTEPISFDLDFFHTVEELEAMFKDSIPGITLCLTEQCNFRCQYCTYYDKYIDKNYKLKTMSQETAFKAVDLLMNHSKNAQNISIAFYGGEPLIQFGLIKKIIEYCKEKYPFNLPQYAMTTNGLLFGNEKIIDFLIANNFLINVSLDGPRDVHNAHRFDVNGEPSFEKVFKNLIHFYKKNPKFFKNNFSISTVTTPITRSQQQYEFLDNLCKGSIIFSDVIVESEYFKDILEKFNQNYEEEQFEIGEFLFNNQTYLLNTLKKYHKILKFTSESYTNELQKQNPSVCPGGFCLIGLNKTFVNTDGNIILCERVNENLNDFYIGNVENGINIEKIQQLLLATKKLCKKCQNCWAVKFCDACFMHFPYDNDFCKKMKKDIEENIRYYIENVKDNESLKSTLDNLKG
jgi:uncharacterized protein